MSYVKLDFVVDLKIPVHFLRFYIITYFSIISDMCIMWLFPSAISGVKPDYGNGFVIVILSRSVVK